MVMDAAGAFGSRFAQECFDSLAALQRALGLAAAKGFLPVPVQAREDGHTVFIAATAALRPRHRAWPMVSAQESQAAGRQAAAARQ